MPFLKRYKKSKLGLPPGTIVYTGEERKEPISFTLIEYNEINFEKIEITNISDFFKRKKTNVVSWLTVQGVHDVDIIEILGKEIDLHPIVMEDISNIHERIKIEILDKFLFIVMKSFDFTPENLELTERQISFLLYENKLITFLEEKSNIFNSIINRIQSEFSRIRKLGNDYLLHSLIDIIVDSYFTLLEIIGDKVSDIEEELVTNPDKNTLMQIQHAKHDIIQIRKIIFPIREVINAIIRGDSPIIKEATHIYFRDAYDHIIRIIETLESYRDMVSGLLDIYLSSISNRMNEVMKVLTIIATIFIPLTFIAGVYGMNFLYMPELGWKYSYLVIWIIMLIVAIIMVIYFRRKKWI
ncbi:MAG: magnesium/cobalt transporter CorA [Candidatus Heimdallarchaeota archaeon]|nr:magnesium/cobalt transporter CorA [Candidatus Heimdallarchaeota archaeon]